MAEEAAQVWVQAGVNYPSDAKAGLDYGATALTFSNSYYNPVEGSRLYNEYLEEYILVEECGADGIMLEGFATNLIATKLL